MVTQEGAGLIHMSHPAFIMLLDEGKIPFHRIGNSRKVNCTDIIDYKQELDRKRLKALDELSEQDQSTGLGYYENSLSALRHRRSLRNISFISGKYLDLLISQKITEASVN